MQNTITDLQQGHTLSVPTGKLIQRAWVFFNHKHKVRSISTNSFSVFNFQNDCQCLIAIYFKSWLNFILYIYSKNIIIIVEAHSVLFQRWWSINIWLRVVVVFLFQNCDVLLTVSILTVQFSKYTGCGKTPSLVLLPSYKAIRDRGRTKLVQNMKWAGEVILSVPFLTQSAFKMERNMSNAKQKY